MTMFTVQYYYVPIPNKIDHEGQRKSFLKPQLVLCFFPATLQRQILRWHNRCNFLAITGIWQICFNRPESWLFRYKYIEMISDWQCVSTAVIDTIMTHVSFIHVSILIAQKLINNYYVEMAATCTHIRWMTILNVDNPIPVHGLWCCS